MGRVCVVHFLFPPKCPVVPVPRQRCPCRKPHPSRSGGMFVLVEDAAEALASSYVEAGYLVRICDWLGQWVQRAGVGDALVWAVSVVELPGLAESVGQVALVPDQGAVQEFVPA